MKTVILIFLIAGFIGFPQVVVSANLTEEIDIDKNPDSSRLESSEQKMPWAIGGVGGVYLLADPGELEIEIFKRDLHVRGGRHDFHVMLTGPDRRVLEEIVMPHSGGTPGDPPGPVSSIILKTRVDRSGIYVLKVFTKGDRHGLNIAWGLRTNAASWVIETSRGHRDERHVEPIVLLDADRPADVNFLPRSGTFNIEVEGLPQGAGQLELYDDRGKLVANIPVSNKKSTDIRRYLGAGISYEKEGSANFTVPAARERGQGLWRLHLPKGQAYLNIDGVTRWEEDDRYNHLCVWTPDRHSWFPLLDYRWLISPYQRTIWADPGKRESITFQVHNNASEARKISLSLEFPNNNTTARLSVTSVRLDPGQSQDVEVYFTSPPEGDEWVCYVRATPELNPGVSSYASLTVRGGNSPAAQPLSLPLTLQPFSHENKQFGYLPGYPTDNQVYFDLDNRPYVLTSRYLHRQVEDDWVVTDINKAIVRQVPDNGLTDWSAMTTKIAFDSENHLYLLGDAGGTAALLHSVDNGATFTAYHIPGCRERTSSWDFEQSSGFNVPRGPPPVLRITQIHVDDTNIPVARRDPRVRWRRVNDLELIIGEKEADGSIKIRKPILLSNNSIGISMHSGIPSSVVSRGSKVHVVWGEATDPTASQEEIPGVPGFVVTYDRKTGTLNEPLLLSYGAPPNDVHNTPGITIDSQGYLHILIGTHGRPFQYLRSLKPNDAYSGWTEPSRTSKEELRQTYVGLVCGADDALHVVYRLWRSGEEYLDGALWAALAYQRKLPGKDWEEPRILVAPPYSDYSIYYHRLTVDREGNLFLSYDYWSTMWFYRNDQRGAVSAGSGRPGRGWGRAVITSGDGGNTWQLW